MVTSVWDGDERESKMRNVPNNEGHLRVRWCVHFVAMNNALMYILQ